MSHCYIETEPQFDCHGETDVFRRSIFADVIEKLFGGVYAVSKKEKKTLTKILLDIYVYKKGFMAVSYTHLTLPTKA